MKQSNAVLWTIMAVLLIAVFFLSLAAGRFAIEPAAVCDILMRAVRGDAGTDMASTVVLELRLPRTLLAMLVGAGLSLSGAVYQGIFRNPLVSPDVLGVSSGAGFGAVLGYSSGGQEREHRSWPSSAAWRVSGLRTISRAAVAPSR